MMSLPKSRLEPSVGRIAAQLLHQELGLEDIDAHRGQRHVRLVRECPADRRLLDEGDDAVLGPSTCMTPKPVASMRGTSRQPMVTSAPVSTCCCSISS
jgi:hypothetical protein